MSFQNQLVKEINVELNRLMEERQEWNAKWIAHAICKNHFDGLADNDHRDYWEYCGYRTCRDEVRRCINARIEDRPEGVKDRQLLLHGFEHLQAYYVVHRGDEDVGVPIDNMTAAEIEEKATLYRAMGKACFKHADELERYLSNRREVA